MDAEGKFFGAEQFNPRLITTQIVAMQGLFFFTITSLTSCANFLSGEQQSMSSLFLWEDYTWSTRRGVVLVCCVWATALVMAVSLRFIVERAKKCLDFVCTYHFFNLVATWLMSGLPLSYRWWVVQGVGLLIAVLLGEWICFLEETKEIKVNKPRLTTEV